METNQLIKWTKSPKLKKNAQKKESLSIKCSVESKADFLSTELWSRRKVELNALFRLSLFIKFLGLFLDLNKSLRTSSLYKNVQDQYTICMFITHTCIINAQKMWISSRF